METLGQFIKRIRMEKGLSQADLEKKVGLPATYVSKLENDNFKSIKEKTLESLAEGLGVAVTELKTHIATETSKVIQVCLDDLPDDVLGKIVKLSKTYNISEGRALVALIENPAHPEEALLFTEHLHKDS